MFRAVVRAGWSRTRSSDQSERCTKETSTCDKIETILPKRWRPCKEHRKIHRRVEESNVVQSMWCHRSLGRRLLTACQKPQEDFPLCKGQRKRKNVVGSGERNLMAKDEEVHRTTRLWRSTTFEKSNVTYEGSSWIRGSGLWCCQESAWSETCRSDGTDMCTRR